MKNLPIVDYFMQKTLELLCKFPCYSKICFETKFVHLKLYNFDDFTNRVEYVFISDKIRKQYENYFIAQVQVPTIIF